MSFTLRIGPLAAAALYLLVSGCSAPHDAFPPVAGKVVYKGKPLETGAVIFSADASKGNSTKHEPRGSIDRQGNFTLTTAGKPGAPPGWYRVGVVSTKPPGEKNPYAVPASLIPTRYNDPEKSGLAVEVVEKAAPGAYDLDLK